jgi:hypothetical protein
VADGLRRAGDPLAPLASLAATAALGVLDLDVVVRVLAEAVADRVAARLNDAAVGYVDQSTSPLPKRVYLEAARRGDFPTARVGKRVIATRADFDAWLVARRRTRASRADCGGMAELDRLLAAGGVAPAPGTR